MTTKSELPPDWDPKPADREWWRHSQTGDRGYRVRRNGKDMVRLDRPEELLQTLVENGQWVRDEYGSLFVPEQIARVAFAADRAMCVLVGLHAESRTVWQDLPDKVRHSFVAHGPPKSAHPARRRLYDAIVEALQPDTRL